MKSRRTSWIGILLLTLAVMSIAQAGPVTIPNANFDTAIDGTDWKANIYDGQVRIDSAGGGSDGNSAPYAVMNGNPNWENYFWQSFTETIDANEVFTAEFLAASLPWAGADIMLRVSFGYDSGGSFVPIGIPRNMIIGGVWNPYEWPEKTFSFTAMDGESYIGQNLAIMFTSQLGDSGWVGIDNVRINTSVASNGGLYTKNTDNKWVTDGNWEFGSAPNDISLALIQTAGIDAPVIEANDVATAQQVVIGTTVGNGDLTVTSGSLAAAQMQVGIGGTGTLYIDGGDVTIDDNVVLGDSEGASVGDGALFMTGGVLRTQALVSTSDSFSASYIELSGGEIWVELNSHFLNNNGQLNLLSTGKLMLKGDNAVALYNLIDQGKICSNDDQITYEYITDPNSAYADYTVLQKGTPPTPPHAPKQGAGNWTNGNSNNDWADVDNWEAAIGPDWITIGKTGADKAIFDGNSSDCSASIVAIGKQNSNVPVGELLISGGNLEVGYVKIGVGHAKATAPDVDSSLTVTGGTFTASNNISFGEVDGYGVLNVSDGLVSTEAIYCAEDYNTTGEINISGGEVRITNGEGFIIDANSMTINITGDGIFTLAGNNKEGLTPLLGSVFHSSTGLLGVDITTNPGYTTVRCIPTFGEFVSVWLDNQTTPADQIDILIDDIEGYTSATLADNWAPFAREANAGTSSSLSLLTTAPYEGSQAVRWNFDLTGGTYADGPSADILFTLPAEMNMVGYDNISLMVKADIVGEGLTFAVILLDSDLTPSGDAYLIGPVDASELGENWEVYIVSLRNPSLWADGHSSNDDLTNVAGIWLSISDVETSTANGTIDIDLIELNDAPTCETLIEGDMNNDCVVNLLDYAILAEFWL